MDCAPGAIPPAAAPNLPLQDLRAIARPPIELLFAIARRWNSLGSRTRQEISADNIPHPMEGPDGLPRYRQRCRPHAKASSLSIASITALRFLCRLPPAERNRADRFWRRLADSTWSAKQSPRTTSSNFRDQETSRTNEPVQSRA